MAKKNLKTALIVEDEVITALSFKRFLESDLDFKVVGVANSGEKAVELCKEKKPDLVFMDIKLKGKLDGIQAAEIIRFTDDVPIIFVSATLNSTNHARAGKISSSASLVKPIHDSMLRNVIEKLKKFGQPSVMT